MSLWVRIVLLLVLAGGLGALAWIATADPTDEAGGDAAPVRWQSSRQCRECHAEVWDEWWGSHHQIAYLNPEVRKLSDDFRNKECQACHLPRPVSVTGYGERVLPRITHPDEGVSCLTCHLGADGAVLARHDRPNVGCRPRASEDLLSVELCQSCHNQHQTTDQWRASRYAAEGVHCNDCHMPEVERAHGGTGRSHVYPGAHDEDMLRAAGETNVAVEDGDLVVAVTNVGAGHNFPTEERHRAVDVMVRFTTAEGGHGDWQRAWRFRQPYRDEPGENTQLPADETYRVRVPIPDGAVGATVRLWYRLTPYVGDDDPQSTLLLEKEVVLQ